jgi:hypothetical protein
MTMHHTCMAPLLTSQQSGKHHLNQPAYAQRMRASAMLLQSHHNYTWVLSKYFQDYASNNNNPLR